MRRDALEVRLLALTLVPLSVLELCICASGAAPVVVSIEGGAGQKGDGQGRQAPNNRSVVRGFLEKLQGSVARRSPSETCTVIEYPVLVMIDRKRRKILSARDCAAPPGTVPRSSSKYSITRLPLQ
jgi:hypothetical protein